MKNIYLDSCIVIYLVERHPIFAPVIKKALVEAGDIILSVSPLSLSASGSFGQTEAGNRYSFTRTL